MNLTKLKKMYTVQKCLVIYNRFIDILNQNINFRIIFHHFFLTQQTRFTLINNYSSTVTEFEGFKFFILFCCLINKIKTKLDKLNN